jgi:uncharacterized protein (TIRG00374 family)
MTQLPPEESSQKKGIYGFIKFFIFFGLGIVIVWLSLKDLTQSEKEQILYAFKTAGYGWVILALGMGILSHILRALRWIIFFEPMGFKPGLKNTFYAVMVGYFANMAFPRLGEVTRCGILMRYENIPFQKAFGTVITERAIDMIIFILLFIAMALTQMGVIRDYLDYNVYPRLVEKFGMLHYSRMLILFFAGTAFIMFLIFLLIRKRIRNFMIYKKVKNLILGFWEGLKSLSQIRQPFLFTFYSIAIWALYFFMLYVIFFCFRETSQLGMGAGLSALVLGSVGIMITPGGIGLYPAIIQETLFLYAITRTIGLALGWLAWVTQSGMIISVGSISLILISFNKRRHGKT